MQETFRLERSCNMNEWEVVIELLLFASTKFLIAPFLAEALHQLPFLKSFIITTTGGFAGIIFFTLFSEGLILFFKKVNRFYLKLILSEEKFRERISTPAKKFTWKNKFIVKMKMKFGLNGIAFVTPCIISIPFGCFVAVAFFKKKLKIIAITCLWLLFWSLLLNYAAQYLGLSKLII